MTRWTILGALLLNGYLLGVMVLFATVTYPGFGAVDRNAFPSLYKAFTSAIPLPVVSVEFLAFVVTLALYRFRPEATPLWLVHVVVALGVAYFGVTFGFHLPAHRVLAQGDNSAAALAPILVSQWSRAVVQLARVALLAWVASDFLKS